MKLSSTTLLLVEILSSVGALLLSIWAGMPWCIIAGVGILFFALIVREVFPETILKNWGLCAGCGGSFLGLGYLLFGSHYWDGFHAVWGSLVTLPLFLISLRRRTVPANQWLRMMAMLWALATDAVWFVSTYQQNNRLGFYAALLSFVILLLLAKRFFRLPTVAALGINTGIFFAIGLPLANFCVSPADSFGIAPAVSERPFSYEFFKKNPAGFVRWMNYYAEQSRSIFQRIYFYKPEGPLTYQLRPNSEGIFCQSRISINSKGFRGAEIAEEKKDTYRIVVLGESTTFGWTIYPDQKPWPELLEKMIAERLKPARHVEVINAGVPAYNINQNLYRLPRQILPLKPDLLISYHGYNGFSMVNGSLPPVTAAKPPPVYQRRPLKLLADVEYQIKLNDYKRHLVAKTTLSTSPLLDPMDSGYAAAYRQLIQICQTNQIHLVLSTYSMAVNDQSDKDVIQFYRGTILSLPTILQADLIHNAIVRQLVRLNPEVGFVDTQPDLDGAHEKFIDVMHFSPEGDQQMAETFFAGIKDFLVKDLATPDNTH